MKSLGKLAGMALVLALGVALSWNDVSAQVQKGNKGGTKTTDSATTSDLLTAPLFPAETIAKLKLTADQKKDYDAIVKDFNDELKKLQSAPATGGGSSTPPPKGKGTKGAGKGGNGSPDTPTAKAITLRAEYEGKVEKILTEAQMKILEDIRIAKVNNPLVGGTSKK